MLWYVVINQERRVLAAVYGSALEREAEVKRNELRERFPLAVVDLEAREMSERPSVGEIV